MGTLDNDLFLRALLRLPTERTPVWIMRQAGRYMPEYRKLREKHTLLDIVRHPELALEVTLQPMKLGVDAAILFADILLILEPMGAPFEFVKGEGPVVHDPVRTVEDIERLRDAPPETAISADPRRPKGWITARAPRPIFARVPA